MVENLISGLYLLGDVSLLGLLVYKSHKSANRTKRGSSNKSAKASRLKAQGSRLSSESNREIGFAHHHWLWISCTSDCAVTAFEPRPCRRWIPCRLKGRMPAN